MLMEPLLEERRIEWSWSRRDDLGDVAVDKNQLEQVLLNVLKNAAEAIGEDGRIDLFAGPENGRRVLEIRDTGRGLDEEAQRGIFRPFYTTKENGRGLGLTLVNEILTNHGFAFSLENREEGGAVFRLVLR